MFKTNLKVITDRQSAVEAAKRWRMSKRRVLQLCKAGKIYAAKKIDGQWTIPVSAVKPVDGRQNRSKSIPKHLKIILDYADAAIRDVPKSERGWSQAAFDYFVLGSAFHMHTIDTSQLNFSDVCHIFSGEAVPGKLLYEQMEVIYHRRAIRFLADAIRYERRLSVKLVEELHGLIQCGNKYLREPMKERNRVGDCIKRIQTLKMHPICKAADFLVRFLLLCPFSQYNEVTAYLVANFILMSNGYPPIIIYRAVFKWWDKWCRINDMEMDIPPDNYRLCWEMPTLLEKWEKFLDGDYPGIMPEELERMKSRSMLDPTIFVSLFAKAIRRSCRRGLMRAIPPYE